MMNKTIIYTLMCITLLSIAYAYQEDVFCDTSTPCDIGDYVFNASNKAQMYTTQICAINITDSAGTNLISNTLLTANADGWHNYTLNTATTGDYRYLITCTSGSDTGRKTGVIHVKTSVNTNLGTILSNQAVLSSNQADLMLNLSTINASIDSQITQVPASTWSYATRTLTSGSFNTFTGWDVLQGYVWNATYRTCSGIYG